MAAPRIHAVVLAGGAGERFWPASRARRPKPFLEVVGGRSLLEATIERGRAFAGDRLWVVCGAEHAAPVRRTAKAMGARVLVEPQRRNTAMAVGLAAARIAAEDPDAVMTVLPADHYIPATRACAADVRKAARAAAAAEVLVTLGVRPTRPETGYGYIQLGAPAPRPYARLHQVRRFVEKPNAARARRYVRAGTYLWNAGIFVWSVRTIFEEIETWVPELAQALAPIRAAGRRPGVQVLARAYAEAPSDPIDTAVMERSRRVWTIPVRWHWSDVGTWESLAAELGVSAGSSRSLGGELVHDDLGGNLTWAPDGKPVALLGVEGLAVVDTGDALLVTRLDRSNEVRGIVKGLKAKGRSDVT